jgi:hypothetical protein
MQVRATQRTNADTGARDSVRVEQHCVLLPKVAEQPEQSGTSPLLLLLQSLAQQLLQIAFC